MSPPSSHERSKSGHTQSSSDLSNHGTDTVEIEVTTRKRSASGAVVARSAKHAVVYPENYASSSEDDCSQTNKYYDSEADDHPLVWKCDKISSQHSRVFVKPSMPSILHRQRVGIVKTSEYHHSTVAPIMSHTSQMRVFKLATPFDKRVTAIAWHPKYTRICAAGSKGGDLLLWDTSKEEDLSKDMLKGRGPGGSVQSLVLDQDNPDIFYTASIDGIVTRQLYSDKEGLRKKVFLQTNDWERWYTGLDISFSSSLLVAGNNKGFVSLMSLEGEKVWDLRLHKQKCNFVQFSTRQPWMMSTCSVDKNVKIWDIRNISSKDSALAVLPHVKPVNSAYFSLVSGDKLLTTDQDSQLRVYQAPSFTSYTTIPHPHRQFQHLTAIKATWHPLADIVLAGRYPDPKFPSHQEGELKSIDFFCGVTGTSLLNLHQPGFDKITSLSQMNTTGDIMLSVMSSSMLLWKAKHETQEEGKSSIEDIWPTPQSKRMKKQKKIVEK